MTKRNNKGFSLIDVIIAVAVLSLLVGPILYQVIQTLKVSSQAKERQYVLDNAEYVVGYFQNTSSSSIASTTDALNSTDGNVTVDSYDSGKITCKLYEVGTNASGKPVIQELQVSGSPVTVEYDVTKYSLKDVKLGKNNNTYGREVSVDNLSNTVMGLSGLSTSYQICHSITQDTKPVNADDWELLNDGSLVKYGTSGTMSDVVVGVLVEPKDSYIADITKEDGTIEQNKDLNINYIDPNNADIGFIQNLDASKVALIQGNAAGFDKQAEADFFQLKLNRLKDVNYDQYEQVLTTRTGQTGFNQASQASKITKISLYKTVDKGGKQCYQVDCNVYYYERYKFAPSDANYQPPLRLTYSVYSKQFYTKNKAPDIYFIYEPYVTNSSDNTAEFMYASTDFIEVYNDENCTESKLYLIKPEWDQLSVKYDRYTMHNTGDNYAYEYPTLDDDKFYTKNSSGRLVPVNIKFMWLQKTGVEKPIKVYTNICTEADDQSNSIPNPQKYNKLGNFKNYDSSSDTIVDTIKTSYPAVVATSGAGGVNGTLKSYFGDAEDDLWVKTPGVGQSESDVDYILPISQDKDKAGRLYTITVTFTQKDESGNTTDDFTRFTGAKEGN